MRLHTPSVALLFAVLLGGCGARVGEPCRTTGSGFTLRDPCNTKCLDLWTVTCADGSTVSPALCAGEKGCTPGSCPEGQACYHFDDPVDVVAYCLPVQACPVPPASAEELSAWEVAAEEKARATRSAFSKIRERPKQPRPD